MEDATTPIRHNFTDGDIVTFREVQGMVKRKKQKEKRNMNTLYKHE